MRTFVTAMITLFLTSTAHADDNVELALQTKDGELIIGIANVRYEIGEDGVYSTRPKKPSDIP